MTFSKRVLFAASVFFTALHAFAQVDAEISMTPKNPEPNQEVTLTLISYTFDINVAKITWKSKETVLLTGLGAKQLKVTSGNIGTENVITYLAESARGEVVTGSITLSPQFVDLMYESPESYVPPFYEGRSLPSEGARVRVIALPSLTDKGKLIPTSNLSFSWYINGEFYQTTAGSAGSSASIPLDYLTTGTIVKVMVRSPLGSVAEKTITIYPVQPSPLFYSYDEILGGDYSRAYTGRIELSKDITLLLEPFHLSAKGTLDKSTKYSWFVDGLPVAPQEKNMLSLKPKPDVYGSRRLSVIVENTKRILQKAQLDAEVIFDTRQ